MNARFKHDCPDCRFLGQWDAGDSWPRQFDLYVCRGTVIARYGNENYENISAPIKYAAPVGPLAVAKERAAAPGGLAPHEQEMNT